MLLSDLIADADAQPRVDLPLIPITGLTADSRAVKPGFLFAAFAGVKQDGRTFIADAVANGAAAVLAPKAYAEACAVPVITSSFPRKSFAKMAAAFYDAQPATIAAVTGTNGKSSTVSFCRQIWQSLGIASAGMGTLGIVAPHMNRPYSLTTPDPVTLHADIAALAKDGVTHLALEASSQGLHQCRLDGLRISVSAFTNLTRDHLDYHGDMDAYFAAKARLFSDILPRAGTAVINADSDYGAAMRGICDKRGIRVLSYGETGEELHIAARAPLPHGQKLSLSVFGDMHDIDLPLVGDFQAMNALCALGIVLAEAPSDKALRAKALVALGALNSVRGRLELAARTTAGAAVYVDYAHTPDGLETMLKALRPHAHGRLHVVFGCGGDRDRGKRPMMGGIAMRLADCVIVTDDNPRTENAAAIRADVMQGCLAAQTENPNTALREIGGRRDAIAAAVQNLKANDVLVIAGKGHEQGQIVGTTVLPFDDVTEAQAAVRASSGKKTE